MVYKDKFAHHFPPYHIGNPLRRNASGGYRFLGWQQIVFLRIRSVSEWRGGGRTLRFRRKNGCFSKITNRERPTKGKSVWSGVFREKSFNRNNLFVIAEKKNPSSLTVLVMTPPLSLRAFARLFQIWSKTQKNPQIFCGFSSFLISLKNISACRRRNL